MKNTIIVFTLISALTIQRGIAQSSFLDSSKNAMSFGIAYGSNNEARSIGGGIAFTLKSRFDIRLTIAFVSIPNTSFSGFGISPSFEYQLLKQGTLFPFNVSLGLSVENISYTDKYVQNNEVNIFGLSVFGGISYSIYLNDGIIVQPSYSIRHSWLHVVMKNSGLKYYYEYYHAYYSQPGLLQEVNDNLFNHDLGISFALKTGNDVNYIVTPALLISKNTPVIGVEFSIIH